MNKRSLTVEKERPRSARLRRKPSIDVTGDEKPTEPTKGTTDSMKNNSQYFGNGFSDKINNRLAMGKKNFSIGKQPTAQETLTVSSNMDFLESQSTFVKFSEMNREPPKSPRLLPKLARGSAQKPNENKLDGISEKPDILKIPAPAVLPSFLDKDLGSDHFQLQFGKHYSVLPNITISNETENDGH